MATTYTELLKLPKHDTTDPFDITLINDMADLVDTAMGKAYRGRAAHNLLGNGHFKIAQPGYHALHGTRYYAADRWLENTSYQPDGVTYDPAAGLSIVVNTTLGRATIQQYAAVRDVTKAYTLGVKANGTVYVVSGVPSASGVSAGNTTAFRIIMSLVNGLVGVQLDAYVDTVIEWAGLVEGVYTAADFPVPVERDDAQDLLACQRYAIRLAGGAVYYSATQITSSIIDFTIPLPVAMRVKPSIANGTLTVYSGGTAQSGFTFSVNAMDNNAISIRAEKASHGLTSAMLSLSNVLLSADLV